MKLIYLLALVPSLALGQGAKESADKYFNEQAWESAAKEYKFYLKSNASDSSAWYNLGQSQMQLAQYEESLLSLDRAGSTNFNKHLVAFTKLRVYAKQGDEEKVLNNLEKEAEGGLVTYALLENSEEFDPWRDTERFQKALKQIEVNAYPCLRQEEYRHFDFWLGEWDVYVGGNKVGENRITLAKGGCAIHESYTTQRNYAGQSINYYDPIDKKWHQHWVGAGRDVYNYMEVDRGPGMLQFESPFMNPGNGQITLSRLTFTLNEDGTVRQLFESSSDDGETWSNAFDGLYRKKE